MSELITCPCCGGELDTTLCKKTNKPHRVEIYSVNAADVRTGENQCIDCGIILKFDHTASPRGDSQLVAKFMLDHGFKTGTAESIPDLLGELSRQIFEIRKGAK